MRINVSGALRLPLSMTGCSYSLSTSGGIELGSPCIFGSLSNIDTNTSSNNSPKIGVLAKAWGTERFAASWGALSPVLRITAPFNKPGFSVSAPIPTGPPQSWPTYTKDSNWSCARTLPIQRIWLSSVCCCEGILLEKPSPTMVGMISRIDSFLSSAAILR